MSVGFNRELQVVNLGDTAKLTPVLYDENDVPSSADDLVSVSFQIAAPDNSRKTLPGVVQGDGSGLLILPTTLTPPVISVSTSTLGGSLAAGTYFYKVTATSAEGETTASNEVSITTTGITSTITLTWPAVFGAAGYNVYRSTGSGTETLLSNGVLRAVTSFVDTGTNTLGTGTPPTINSGTTEPGHYTVVATFTISGGEKRSVRADFEAFDPFASVTPSQSYIAAEAAWTKIEDCFDAEEDGPWLRDMTATYFTKEKMEAFIAEALFFINQANPPTTLDIGSFVMSTSPPTPTVDLPLLAQGIFIVVLRHLTIAYVEQPNPVGAQIAWHDRRDYLQRWQSVLQTEQAAFDKMLALYKRRYLGLGQARLLISSKAGRLLPASMRTRFVGRGYW